MQRHEIQLRYGSSDKAVIEPMDARAIVRRLDLVNRSGVLDFGLDQVARELADRGLTPSRTAMDLLVLAIGVQVADTRIARAKFAQDSWTREIGLNVPVLDTVLWQGVTPLLERMLAFLSGDRWSLSFRKAPKVSLVRPAGQPNWPNVDCDSVCLFSGGLDSLLGAIELLSASRRPLLVSHYWDLGTSSQSKCADHLTGRFGDVTPRHLRAYIGADKNNFPLAPGEEPDNSQRARSFIFFALAAVAASSLAKQVTIYVPENGFVSLNVPLDPHRLGAWSTRTTHPFYMARWNQLLQALRVKAELLNPFQTMTKGEMILASPEPALVQKSVGDTLSCSSVSKARWNGLPAGHCGHCFPCIIRRAAELKGLGREVTTYQGLASLGEVVNKQKALGENLWSFRVMSERLSLRPSDAKAIVNVTGPLADAGFAERSAYADVFLRGIREVADAMRATTFR